MQPPRRPSPPSKGLSLRKPSAPTTKVTSQKPDWRKVAQSVKLKSWYPSEIAKRNFGPICRAVNVQRQQVSLMGTEQKPLVEIFPSADIPQTQFEIAISIDEARADWPSVLLAVMLYGTVFRVSGTHNTHAVIKRHALNRHGAFRYRRPQLEDIPQNFSILLDDLRDVSDKFDTTTKMIDRRFKEVWRDKNL